MSEKADPAPGSAPDQTRSLRLLWASRNKVGRSGLSLGRIVEAALELADTEGLQALSMRRVAEKVGVGTMTLYSYAPGKQELTDLMFDTLMGRLYSDADEARRQGNWRAGMTFVAQQNWKLQLAHPWLTALGGARPILGPNVILKYEAELRPLEGIGLQDRDMDALLSAVLTLVEGAARSLYALRQAAQTSEQTDLEWWLQQSPVLEQLLDTARFPTASRVGQSVGSEVQAAADPEHALRFGLDLLLDGVAALLSSRGRP